MKTNQKEKVEVSKTETPKVETNHPVVLPKKRLTVAEKLDKIQAFDAIHGRYDYLSGKKRELDQFAKTQNGFMGAQLELEDSEGNVVKISNPLIVEELVSLAKMRCQEQIVKTEKEIESFEVL